MTRAQRTVHRLVWALLAPLLAAILAFAVLHRSDASSRQARTPVDRGARE